MSQDRMVTPEAVALQFQTANVGSRIIAAVVDWSIIVVVALVATLILVASADALNALDLPDYLPVVALILLSVAWVFGYFIAQETLLRGRTAGKAAMGLRVVTKEGGQIRFRHALIRGIFMLVDFLATFGVAGVATIAISERNQRLGDMVAGTIVLRERTAVASATSVTFAPPRALEPYTDSLDTTRLGAQEYQAIRSFLLRSRELDAGARYDLAVQLANPVRARVRPLPPDRVQPEDFLTAVAAAYQRRQRTTTTPGQVAQQQPMPNQGQAWPGSSMGQQGQALPDSSPWRPAQPAQQPAQQQAPQPAPPTHEPAPPGRRDGGDFAPPS